MTTILDTVAHVLNGPLALAAGLSNGDAVVNGNSVTFTYPAPVVSGACCGSVVLQSTGTLYDDITGEKHNSLSSYMVSLAAMVQAA